MITVTRIFRFEMAHAINGYPGKCKNLHGHSYELHVTVGHTNKHDDYIKAPGFIIDFKELKSFVQDIVVSRLDHAIVLSEEYLSNNNSLASLENICPWKNEPTAENILVYIKDRLQQNFPPRLELVKLKLYETKDSYAEWTIANTFN